MVVSRRYRYWPLQPTFVRSPDLSTDSPYKEILELVKKRVVIDLHLHGSVPLVDGLDRRALVIPEHDLVEVPLEMAFAELGGIANLLIIIIT